MTVKAVTAGLGSWSGQTAPPAPWMLKPDDCGSMTNLQVVSSRPYQESWQVNGLGSARAPDWRRADKSDKKHARALKKAAVSGASQVASARVPANAGFPSNALDDAMPTADLASSR